MSQKDNITKHACDKEFKALKACIKQAVSFLDCKHLRLSLCVWFLVRYIIRKSTKLLCKGVGCQKLQFYRSDVS